MKKYRVTIKHDNGKFNILLLANSEEHAIMRVMNVERCPRCAIIAVKQMS